MRARDLFSFGVVLYEMVDRHAAVSAATLRR